MQDVSIIVDSHRKFLVGRKVDFRHNQYASHLSAPVVLLFNTNY